MKSSGTLVLAAFTVCDLFRRNGAHDVRPDVLRVHATARSIHIQLRVAVLRSPPRPESLRSASAAKQTAHGTLVAFGGTTFVFLRARRPATARSRLASRALHPPSAARYVVGGIPPSLSRLHLSVQLANRPRGSRFCSPPPPRSRLHLGSGAFFFVPFLRVVGLSRLRLAAAVFLCGVLFFVFAPNALGLGDISDSTAIRIALAAIKRLAVALPLSKDHLAAAKRAKRLVACPDVFMPPLKILNVTQPTFPADGRLPFFNCQIDLPYLPGFDERGRNTADICRCRSRIDHIRRHFCLELTVARKGNHAMEIRLVDPKIVRQGADMPVILTERILELTLLAWERLRPLGTFFISENPPRIRLRLDDKYSKLRNDNMVNLRRGSVRKR